MLAIIITIMVLELQVPHDQSPEALLPLVPTALYGAVLLMALMWFLPDRRIERAMGSGGS